MINSAQRARLRGLANDIEPILHIGKDGIGENLVKQADEALAARELIKGTVQRNAEYTAKEALEELARRLGAEPVQAIGRRFTLYRKAKEPKILL